MAPAPPLRPRPPLQQRQRSRLSRRQSASTSRPALASRIQIRVRPGRVTAIAFDLTVPVMPSCLVPGTWCQKSSGMLCHCPARMREDSLAYAA